HPLPSPSLPYPPLFRSGDLDAMFAQDAATLRCELLGIWGIGEETADAITLFAAHQPAFIVDAYTTRIVRRLGLVSEGGTRHEVQIGRAHVWTPVTWPSR